MNSKTIKFKELLKQAGYESISEFVKNSINSKGLSRSSSQISTQLRTGITDEKELELFSVQLDTTVRFIRELFNGESDFDFVDFLCMNGFKKDGSKETSHGQINYVRMQNNENYIVASFTDLRLIIIMVSEANIIPLQIASLPFVPYTRELAGELLEYCKQAERTIVLGESAKG